MRLWILLIISLGTLAVMLGAAAPDESIVLTATEDTYVVADISKADDPEQLREQNFGGLDFIKVWYAFQVKGEEQVVSLGLFKFDLSPVKDKDIRSAHLQLFALRTDLAQPARLVDVSLVEGPWNEAEVKFNNLPSLSASPLATTAVYGANVWYSWDVTAGVIRRAEDGAASFILGLRTLENQKEEQVVFASREVGRNAPRLVVTYPAAAPTLPLPVLAGAAAAVAMVAFGGGLLMGRLSNRRRARPAEADGLANGRADEPPVAAHRRSRRSAASTSDVEADSDTAAPDEEQPAARRRD